MPSRLIDIICVPVIQAPSQTTATVTVLYTADGNGNALTVTCPASHTVAPPTVVVDATANGVHPFVLTVRRNAATPPGSVAVAFTLFGDARIRLVEVL